MRPRGACHRRVCAVASDAEALERTLAAGRHLPVSKDGAEATKRRLKQAVAAPLIAGGLSNETETSDCWRSASDEAGPGEVSLAGQFSVALFAMTARLAIRRSEGLGHAFRDQPARAVNLARADGQRPCPAAEGLVVN